MQHDRKLAKFGVLATISLVGAGSLPAATATFTPTRAASGVSWAPAYSVPGNEGGSLAIGALDNGGTPFLTATLLGYDLSSLAGKYASIDSVTLTGTVRDKYPDGGSGTVDLFRVDAPHADWTSGATWSQQTGAGNPWANGATMGTVETGTAIASVTVTRGSAVGTAQTWTITGAAAKSLVDDWASGINSGLALADSGTGGDVDYRANIGGIQGTVAQPTLTVTFTPVHVPASLTWRGADGSNPAYWDINGTANWTGVPSGRFLEGDNVLFDDSAATFSVDIREVVSPANVTLNNTTAYTLSSGNDSGIEGFCGLVKNGSGLLTITAPNNFTGIVAINSGTISVPAVDNTYTPLGQGAVSLGDADHAGTLRFTGPAGSTNRSFSVEAGGGAIEVSDPAGTLILNGGISGTGALTKTGDGRLELAANNSSSGGVTVNAGTLALRRYNEAFNASQIRGVLTINSGATLVVEGFPFGYGGGLTDLNVNHAVVTGGGLGTFGVRYNLAGGTITTTSRMDLGTRNGVDGAIHSLASDTTAVVTGSAGLMLRGDSGQQSYIFTVAQGTTPSGIDLQLAVVITENAGPCSIIKAGSGTLELTGANNFTGDTTVQAGTLAVTGNSIADANKLVISGGKLALVAAANETVNSLYFDGTLQAPGTYGSSASGAVFKDDTRFSGTGILTVTTGAANVDYDDWLGGFTFAPGADTTPTGDPDGDGMDNRREYAFGLDPTSGSSVAPVTTPFDKGTGMFTYTRRKPSLTKLTYRIWTSADLSVWAEDMLAIQTPTDSGTNQSVVVTISGTKPLTAPKLFVRVTAE